MIQQQLQSRLCALQKHLLQKSAAIVVAGTTINFTNQSTGATGYQWYLDGILQTTSVNYSYVSTIAGKHQIKLIAQNTTVNCSDQFIDTITFTCPVNADFTPLASNIPLNTVVNFVNASSGASSYQWLVNGTLSGVANNFSNVFSVAGTL